MAELDGSETDTVVEFFDPAQYWPEALPLGSGRLGAMVYGGVQSELVQLNGKSIYELTTCLGVLCHACCS